MKRKRYEVRGMMEWQPEFRAGRTRFRVSFTGGHLCGGASTPAVYETADPVVQAVIEGSAAFRSGRVHRAFMEEDRPLLRPEGQCADISAKSMTHSNGPTVMEFPDLVSAGDFLQNQKGISVDRVLTREQCLAEARSLGIELKITR